MKILYTRVKIKQEYKYVHPRLYTSCPIIYNSIDIEEKR